MQPDEENVKTPLTKVICTLGPASESPEVIKGLLENGVRVWPCLSCHTTVLRSNQAPPNHCLLCTMFPPGGCLPSLLYPCFARNRTTSACTLLQPSQWPPPTIHCKTAQ